MNIKKILKDTKLLESIRCHHVRLYSALYKVVDIFHKNNINYVLTGGSHLGQIRKKEIILYDDDIDLMIPNSELDVLKSFDFLQECTKFGISCIEKKQPSGYKIYIFLDSIPNDNVLHNKMLYKDGKGPVQVSKTDTNKVIFKKSPMWIEIFPHKKNGDFYEKKLFCEERMKPQRITESHVSLISCDQFEKRKLVKFGPLKVYSTESGQYIAPGVDVSDILYIVFKPHEPELLKYWNGENKQYILSDEEVRILNEFSFNIKFKELLV